MNELLLIGDIAKRLEVELPDVCHHWVEQNPKGEGGPHLLAELSEDGSVVRVSDFAAWSQHWRLRVGNHSEGLTIKFLNPSKVSKSIKLTNLVASMVADEDDDMEPLRLLAARLSATTGERLYSQVVALYPKAADQNKLCYVSFELADSEHAVQSLAFQMALSDRLIDWDDANESKQTTGVTFKILNQKVQFCKNKANPCYRAWGHEGPDQFVVSREDRTRIRQISKWISDEGMATSRKDVAVISTLSEINDVLLATIPESAYVKSAQKILEAFRNQSVSTLRPGRLIAYNLSNGSSVVAYNEGFESEALSEACKTWSGGVEFVLSMDRFHPFLPNVFQVTSLMRKRYFREGKIFKSKEHPGWSLADTYGLFFGNPVLVRRAAALVEDRFCGVVIEHGVKTTKCFDIDLIFSVLGIVHKRMEQMDQNSDWAFRLGKVLHYANDLYRLSFIDRRTDVPARLMGDDYIRRAMRSPLRAMEAFSKDFYRHVRPWARQSESPLAHWLMKGYQDELEALDASLKAMDSSLPARPKPIDVVRMVLGFEDRSQYRKSEAGADAETPEVSQTTQDQPE